MTHTMYNGWTNYATWRVNLELFDGFDPEGYDLENTYDFSIALKDYADDLIFETTREGLGRDYALAFLADVDWYEIAGRIIEDHKQEA